jgi:fumarylpyruvate hydrolase
MAVFEVVGQCSGAVAKARGIIARPRATSPQRRIEPMNDMIAAPGANASNGADVFAAPAVPRVPVHGGGRFPVHRIYCVGRNYAEHAAEMGHDTRESPFFFAKPADAVVPVADGEDGVMDYPGLTQDLHHEVELVVAIGEAAALVTGPVDVDRAAELIFGYAIGLDMTRRDLQAAAKKAGRPWSVAKGFDQSAPIGPVHRLAGTGELRAGAITLDVNGTRRQAGDLASMIWSVRETIAWLSAAWRLQPGDLIFTGTPAGVGAVQRGDRMCARIDGLGELRVVVR